MIWRNALEYLNNHLSAIENGTQNTTIEILIKISFDRKFQSSYHDYGIQTQF